MNEHLDIADRLTEAHEFECKTISGQIHDIVIQRLSGLQLLIQGCRHTIKSGGNVEDALSYLDEIKKGLQGTLDYATDLMNAISPMSLNDFGLIVTIENLCKRIEQQKQPTIIVSTELANEPITLPEPRQLTVFRIFQHLIFYILYSPQNAYYQDHIQDIRVFVNITTSGNSLIISITTNGKCLSQKSLKAASDNNEGSKFFGNKAMTDRIKYVGADFQIADYPEEKNLSGVILKIEMLPAQAA